MNPYSKFKNDFKGKRVLIIGLGLLGRGVNVVKTFIEIGCKVTVTDKKSLQQLKPSLDKLKNFSIKYTLGEHRKEDLNNTDVIIRNPDVNWHHSLLNRARKQQIPIYMDTSLFAKYFTGTLIGITGTRGKTTTTTMIYQLIKKSRKHEVLLAGNVTSKASLSLLKNATEQSIAVAELSSWELQGFREENISPYIAVVTNVYEDHLDHYKNFKEYLADKEAIFKNQSKNDYLILNKNNSWTKKMGKKSKSKVIWFSEKNYPSDWKLHLLGKHNFENAAAAYEVGKLLDLNDHQMKTIFSKFTGVEHRLEIVKEINGVLYINDTTSTTPIATIKAIKAMDRPTILLLGGNDKKLSLSTLSKEIVRNVKAVVYLRGNGTPRIKKEINKVGDISTIADNLPFNEAIKVASRKAKKGDVILLSPAFTSFAEFNNIFERGNRFIQFVKNLKKS